ncbi:biotin-dependent carboxyltransferase family protein [Peribacillus frigoritolerans]|uniref:5-oxoprolinase subunit C family protein n=1 Tax=Peribacillus frigoritolerans TaxID=450367 RepID=UPI00105940EF|nr:biotin-dependent carboxyltransferase family protein [Peribacillus frigoritolerans]TDL83110.1 biotin-dependent carboxyltransferase family protein [Peribacillus frigoritolerans]
MTIKVNKSGLLTSIQDLGRYGSQKYGVIASGAMDTLSHRIANMLVGNSENEAAIEMTLIGAHFEFQSDSMISVCGGDLSPILNDRPAKMWKPLFVKKGSLLSFGGAKKGCRAYLAVAGGIEVPEVMGSKSTYLRAGIGGYEGRAIENGDILSVGKMSEQSIKLHEALHDSALYSEIEWSASPEFIPFLREDESVRVIKGRQFEDFSEESKSMIFSETFKITPNSDRMGYRMEGPQLTLEDKTEMISEAVSFGTIQVPADGNPIILLADRQTTGGYPKIAQVASVDLPYLAQFKPGEVVRFKEISLEEAQELLIDRERRLQLLKQGMLLKLN